MPSLSFNQTRGGLAWLCPLSGKDVGGAAVARSGVSGPGRKQPDLGVFPGSALPTRLPAAGGSGADRRASVTGQPALLVPEESEMGKNVISTQSSTRLTCLDRSRIHHRKQADEAANGESFELTGILL